VSYGALKVPIVVPIVIVPVIVVVPIVILPVIIVVPIVIVPIFDFDLFFVWLERTGRGVAIRTADRWLVALCNVTTFRAFPLAHVSHPPVIVVG
jgi:hypothetical protein